MKEGFFTRLLVLLLFLVGLIGCGSADSPRSTLSARPALLASPTLAHDFGTRLVDEATAVQIEITNAGELPATDMSSAFIISAFLYTGGLYPGISGTCADRLEVKQSCMLDITFQPKYAGTFQEYLHLHYYNGIQHTDTTTPSFAGKGVTEITP